MKHFNLEKFLIGFKIGFVDIFLCLPIRIFEIIVNVFKAIIFTYANSR